MLIEQEGLAMTKIFGTGKLTAMLSIATVGAAVGRVEGEAKKVGAASDPFAK